MKIEQLTFTRFIAALWILLFHFALFLPPFNHESIAIYVRSGNNAVSFFFVLSGFVMIVAYSSMLKINFKQYMRNRIARIYPVYLVAIVLYYFATTLNGSGVSSKAILINLLMIQSWIPGYAMSFNYPSWSVSTEFFFYIIFPFLFNKVLFRYELKYTILGIACFWLLTQIAVNSLTNNQTLIQNDAFKEFLICSPIFHLNQFLIGNATGLIFLKRAEVKGRYDVWIILTLILTCVLLNVKSGLVVFNGYYAIVFALLIYFLAKNEGAITTLLKYKWFVYLGEISFGIYILQVPVYLFVVYFVHSSDSFIVFYTAIISLLIISALSYEYLEKPLRTKIRTK